MTADAAVVERCLSGFLSGPEDELKSIAAKYRALPVYSDMGGTLLITPSLEVLFLDDKDASTPIPEGSEKWRLVAFLSAVEKYPKLQFLVPGRPPTATQCSSCGGSGRFMGVNFRCGGCYGLGWQGLHSNKTIEQSDFTGTPILREDTQRQGMHVGAGRWALVKQGAR